MASKDISADYPFTVHRVKVDNDAEMAYIDTDPKNEQGGNRPPVVFLHGDPMYSYLWRNIIPHVQAKARCIAPDLMGMGASQKLSSDSCGFSNHARHVDSFSEY